MPRAALPAARASLRARPCVPARPRVLPCLHAPPRATPAASAPAPAAPALASAPEPTPAALRLAPAPALGPSHSSAVDAFAGVNVSRETFVLLQRGARAFRCRPRVPPPVRPCAPARDAVLACAVVLARHPARPPVRSRRVLALHLARPPPRLRAPSRPRASNRPPSVAPARSVPPSRLRLSFVGRVWQEGRCAGCLCVGRPVFRERHCCKPVFAPFI